MKIITIHDDGHISVADSTHSVQHFGSEGSALLTDNEKLNLGDFLFGEAESDNDGQLVFTTGINDQNDEDSKSPDSQEFWDEALDDIDLLNEDGY